MVRRKAKPHRYLQARRLFHNLLAWPTMFAVSATGGADVVAQLPDVVNGPVQPGPAHDGGNPPAESLARQKLKEMNDATRKVIGITLVSEANTVGIKSTNGLGINDFQGLVERFQNDLTYQDIKMFWNVIYRNVHNKKESMHSEWKAKVQKEVPGLPPDRPNDADITKKQLPQVRASFNSANQSKKHNRYQNKLKRDNNAKHKQKHFCSLGKQEIGGLPLNPITSRKDNVFYPQFLPLDNWDYLVNERGDEDAIEAWKEAGGDIEFIYKLKEAKGDAGEVPHHTEAQSVPAPNVVNDMHGRIAGKGKFNQKVAPKPTGQDGMYSSGSDNEKVTRTTARNLQVHELTQDDTEITELTGCPTTVRYSDHCENNAAYLDIWFHQAFASARTHKPHRLPR